MGIKNKDFSLLVMIVLIVWPILNIYTIGKYNWGFVVTIVLGIINIVNRGFKNNTIPRWLIIYFVYSYFSHIIANFSISGLLCLRVIRIYVIYRLFFDCIEIGVFVRLYRYIAAICLIFFAFQTVSRFIFDSPILGVATNLPISRGDGFLPVEELFDKNRDSSFFAEPSHFVQFLLPLLVIELFYYKKPLYIFVVILIAALLLLQSGTAIIGVLVIGISFFIKNLMCKRGIKHYIIMGVIISIIVLVGMYYIRSEMGEKMMVRTEQIEDEREISFAMRVLRGYYVYDKYPFVYKIIGNDNPVFLTSMNNKSEMAWTFQSDTDYYYNGLFTFFLFTGYIGMLIFIVFFINSYRRTDYCGKTILLLMIALSIVTENYFGFTMTVCLLYADKMKNLKNQQNLTV